MSVRFNMSKLIAARAKFAALQEQKVLETTQKLTLDLSRKLIEGSPVDSGQFRGAWEIETPQKPDDVGRISNPTPYGPKLAHGSSTQAPDGWIDNAIEAVVRFGGDE
jgi:hypothetical protein